MDQNRRKFLKSAACAVVTLPVLAELTKGRAGAQDLQPVSENDPTAKALGYHADGSKVDPQKFPRKAVPGGEKQSCANCMLMVQTGVKVPGAEGTYGKCSVIQSGLVSEKGWCNSWVQKPGA